MVRAELVKRSPLRILDKSINGGLKAGDLGIIASHKGVGKTACLVYLAVDRLLQGKHVIHISFSQKTDHVVDWYDTVFTELARKLDLDATVVRDEAIKSRMILNFQQDNVSLGQMSKSIEALISDGKFAADILVIDGFDFQAEDGNLIKGLLEFAKESKLALWATADVEAINSGLPKELKPFEDDISVLIDLEPKDSHIRLNLRKDYDRLVNENLHLILDSRTLLIVEE